MRIHLGILLIYTCVLVWNKIMSTYSNVDIVWTFKYHFCLFKMELYLSGADSYLIQIFKWTLESWELIAANSLFHELIFSLCWMIKNVAGCVNSGVQNTKTGFTVRVLNMHIFKGFLHGGQKGNTVVQYKRYAHNASSSTYMPVAASQVEVQYNPNVLVEQRG